MRRPARSPGRALTLLPMALALLACDAWAQQPAYIGKSYTGRLMAEIKDRELPVSRQRSGDASAQFKPTAAGKARMTVTGNVRGQSAGFDVEGSYGPSGFRARDAATDLTIDPTGRISGRAVEGGNEYRLSGTVSADAMALTILWRPGPGAPASTLESITFNYTLDSSAALAGDRSGKAPRGKDGKPCRKTRVEQRVTPSFNGGPMSMGMVIVCDD